jgi:hypothetical protein
LSDAPGECAIQAATLQAADAHLIAAGAGMGVDAGLKALRGELSIPAQSVTNSPLPCRKYDSKRLAMVFQPLVQYYGALKGVAAKIVQGADHVIPGFEAAPVEAE